MSEQLEFSVESFATCLTQVLEPFPVAIAYLFGSVARGQVTPFSDVDVALVVDKDSVAKSVRLKFELTLEDEIAGRCDLTKETYVHVINDAPLVMQGQVLIEGKLLFVRDDKVRVEYETRTLSFVLRLSSNCRIFKQCIF